MKIGTRLMGSILGVLILGLGAMTFWTTELSRTSLTSAILEQQQMAVQGGVQGIFLQIDRYQYAVEEASHSDFLIDVLKFPVDEKFVHYAGQRLESCKRALDGISIFALINAKGLVVASTNKAAVGKQNLADRGYFREAMKGKFVISKPSLSRALGRPSFFMAAPVRVDGIIQGVTYVTIDLEAVSKEILGKLKVGKSGYCFLSAVPGLTLSHPDSKKIFEDTSSYDWMKEMIRRKQGTFEYQWEGIERITTFASVPQTGWILALTAERDDVLSPVDAILRANVTAAVIMLLVVSMVVILVVRGITKALGRAIRFAQAVAGGNLSHELRSVRKDELGILGRALDSMLEQLRNMIATSEKKSKEAETAAHEAELSKKIAEQARVEAENARREGLLEAAEKLDVIVERLASAAEELSSQIEQSAQGADIQRESASRAATAMEKMNHTVQEVAQNASEASSASEAARKEAVEGADIVSSVMQAISKVQENSKVMAQSLNELGTHAEGIGQIMAVISDIADQTNLLALNAAIEAARAGEAGRGFAVVADEVRKLAEKTMTATKQVGDAVRAIQGGTQESIRAMEGTTQNVNQTTDLATQAGEALKHIVKLVGGSTDQVRAIATASEEQSAAAEEINQGTEDINRVASETANSMRQSSQAVIELAEMAQQLTIVVESLKKS